MKTHEIKFPRVDLDIESGGASASLQMHLIQSLREQCGEDFHITFTIPALTYSVEPWKTVITEASQVWPLTQFFMFPFCESMTPRRGNTVLFRSSQQLPSLRLGPLKSFLS